MEVVAIAPHTASPRSPEVNGLFRGTAIFAVVSFLAYLVSLAKTILVSHFFGTSPEMDAFTVAILVPNLLGSLIVGSASAGLVPGLAHAERQGLEHRSDVYRSSLTFFLLGCAIITLIFAMFATGIVRIIAPAFDPLRQSLAIAIARWASLLIFLNAIIGFATAELLSRRKYALVAASPAICSIISLVLLAFYHRRGGLVLVWSLLAGLAVQAVLVFIPAWQNSKNGRLAHWRHPEITGVIVGQFQLLAVSSIGIANGFVDQLVAALLPAGNVSALSYAGNLNMVVMQVVIMAMSSVVLNDLSTAAAVHDSAALIKRVRFCAIGALMLAAPVCVSVWMAGETGIRLLFQHGLFRADSTHLVFIAWAGYSLGLIPAAIGMTASRVANAMRENGLLFRIGIVLLFINAILDYVLMKLAGILGITLSTAFVYCISAFLLFRAMDKRIGKLLDRRTVSRLCLILASTVISVAPALVLRVLLGTGDLSSLFQLGVFAFAVLICYRIIGLISFQHGTGGWRSWSVQLSVEQP